MSPKTDGLPLPRVAQHGQQTRLQTRYATQPTSMTTLSNPQLVIHVRHQKTSTWQQLPWEPNHHRQLWVDTGLFLTKLVNAPSNTIFVFFICSLITLSTRHIDRSCVSPVFVSTEFCHHTFQIVHQIVHQVFIVKKTSTEVSAKRSPPRGGGRSRKS